MEGKQMFEWVPAEGEIMVDYDYLQNLQFTIPNPQF